MKMSKRLLSILLAFVLLLSAAAGLVTASAEGGYKVGDIIEYGTYPQSDVTEAMGTVLGLQNGAWRSYGYYTGTDDRYDGQMKPSDYMRYKDVMYNGCKYRGVTFDAYIPGCTGYRALAEGSTNQSWHGYYTGKVYWFKYEPIKWRVLDPSTGFVMCDSVIDCKPYHNYFIQSKKEKDVNGFLVVWGDPGKTFYAHDYAKSSIRQWLNEDFYNTAFSEGQKSNIKLTLLNNNGWKTLNGYPGFEDYDSPSTTDKIFLLSYDESENRAYGFAQSGSLSDPARVLEGSDYAKCNGSIIGSNACWWLRTPYYYPGCANFVGLDGGNMAGNEAHETEYGVAPAMKLGELKSDREGSPIDTQSVYIRNYTAEKTVGYKTTVTFTAGVSETVPGAEIRWFIDDQDKGAGESYTVKKAKKSFTVQVKYIKDGRAVAISETEKVNVKTGLLARIAAFFLGLFGRLPKVVQKHQNFTA